MALIILEGLDRTGKSSVAQHFEQQGFEVIHMSAPDKLMFQPEYLGPSYLDQMVDMLSSIGGRNVVLDRSHYGELIWPQIYGRKPLLDDEAIEILREIEDAMGVERVLMQDLDSVAHWQRCVDNKEPLTKPQFVKARALYSNMADKYGFIRKTLKDFPNAVQPLPKEAQSAKLSEPKDVAVDKTSATAPQVGSDSVLSKTKEQQKLDKANVINEVLSKRIIKGKGPAYDELERNVRHFLNTELGKIFGNSPIAGFSNEEIDMLKFFCQRLKDKETQ
jgi:hypothetical protein